MNKVFLLVLMIVSLLILSACNKIGYLGLDTSSFNECDLIHDELIAVEKDGHWGYINIEGETIIDFQYEDASAFFDGLAIVKDDEGYFVINTIGKQVFKERYFDLFRSSENTLIYTISTSMGNRFGLMNIDGKNKKEAKFIFYDDYSDGYARVSTNEGVTTFINSEGETDFGGFFFTSRFMNGASRVVMLSENKNYGYFDVSNDTLLIDYIYNEAYDFDAYGYAIGVIDENPLPYYLFDLEGNILLNAYYIEGTGPLYTVQLTEDSNKMIINEELGDFTGEVYEDIYSLDGYNANLSTNGDNNVYIMFNKLGEEIVRYDYESGDLLYISSLDKYVGYETIEEGIQVYFDNVKYFFDADEVSSVTKDNNFILVKDNMFGVVDSQGNQLLDFEYEYVTSYFDGYYVFQQDSLLGIMNSDFEKITVAVFEGVNTLLNCD